jgi:CMP-N-acetylneuraminic acid synthetase
MKKKIKVVSIILARSGSKGLRHKNLLKLSGKPLLYYAIEAGKRTKKIDRVFVSTDSPKIAKIARSYGAEVPFLRKKRYSGDHSSTESAMRNFLDELKSKEKYSPDIIVYFQTTDIFRNLKLVNICIDNLLKDKKLDSSFIVTPVHKNFWKIDDKKLKRLNTSKIYLPRQKKPAIYREDTGLCLATRNKCITQTSRMGKKIKHVINNSKIDMIDIHTIYDLKIANRIIKELKTKPNF